MNIDGIRWTFKRPSYNGIKPSIKWWYFGFWTTMLTCRIIGHENYISVGDGLSCTRCCRQIFRVIDKELTRVKK